MKKMSIFLCFSFLLLPFAGCSDSDNGTGESSGGDGVSLEDIRVIPLPQFISYGRGAFAVDKDVTISCTAAIEDEATLLAGYLKEDHGMEPVVSKDKTDATIQLVIDPALTVKAEGGYRIEVANNKIVLTAKDNLGIFYGSQTVRQLITLQGNLFVVREVSISDYPVFSWRSVMLDEARYFKGKEAVKTLLYEMARLKMNTFHWHLTDDQGWRIEIKKYPKLTSIGGYRNKTIVGYMWDNPTEWDTKRYGGFYTQEDIKEVVAYAQKRFVNIIPEIEMPGHSLSALAAYPEYSCTGGPFEVEGRWGVFNDIYCTKEETFKFLQDVLDEVIALFPSEYIHLGGDEAPRIRWRNCVHCQKRMEQEHLTKEAELQTYFINRIENYLNEKGKKIIGWDEILEGGIPQRATVMSWRGEKGGIHAAKAGYDVIMSPNIYMYLNNHQLGVNDKIGIKKRLISLKKVYDYHPVPAELDKKAALHVKGVQANLWTEYLDTAEEFDYSLYPRMAAVAEVAWSLVENKSYDNFCIRLMDIEKHYDAFGLSYCKMIYDK